MLRPIGRRVREIIEMVELWSGISGVVFYVKRQSFLSEAGDLFLPKLKLFPEIQERDIAMG